MSDELVQSTRKVPHKTATFTQGSYTEENNTTPIVYDGLVFLMQKIELLPVQA